LARSISGVAPGYASGGSEELSSLAGLSVGGFLGIDSFHGKILLATIIHYSPLTSHFIVGLEKLVR
jgi:hypothetical protein